MFHTIVLITVVIHFKYFISSDVFDHCTSKFYIKWMNVSYNQNIIIMKEQK